jgi:hypothetical protein
MSFHGKEKVERLLDRLEAHGYPGRKVAWEEGKGFTVHFRRRAGRPAWRREEEPCRSTEGLPS